MGKVLYGTFPSGILTAVFLLLSFYLTAGTFLTASGLQFPGRRSDRIVPVNVWTAITFVGFFVALTMSRARVSTAELELVENCKENADGLCNFFSVKTIRRFHGDAQVKRPC